MEEDWEEGGRRAGDWRDGRHQVSKVIFGYLQEGVFKPWEVTPPCLFGAPR